MGVRRKAFEWYARRWVDAAAKGKKGADVQKVIQVLRENKAKFGTLCGFVAGGLMYVGYQQAGEVVLLIGGILLGGGAMASDREQKARR